MVMIAVAGSTGAIGKRVVRLAKANGVAVTPLVRPKSAAALPDARAVEFGDPGALAAALRGCGAVLQLIGTMRSRFSTGDTYETSDIGTTRQLVEAAKAAGVRHVVLLSSVGAGGPGPYLKAKAKAEALVTESGLDWTIFRPSSFTGSDDRHVPGVFETITKVFGLSRYRPIHVEDLARAILFVGAEHRQVGKILEGDTLWAEVAEAKARLTASP